MRRRKWRGPDLNRRHHGFQPCALPTELPRRAGDSVAAGIAAQKRDVRTGATASRTSPWPEAYDRRALRASSDAPARHEKSATCEKPRRSSSDADALERHVDRRVAARCRIGDRDVPARRVTRASSSKNGIMLFSVTRSNAPSANGQRGRVGDLVALAVGSAAWRRASRDHLARDVDARPPRRRASAPRRAARRRRCPCRGRAPCAAAAGSASSAARDRREPLGSTRVASHSGARRSNDPPSAGRGRRSRAPACRTTSRRDEAREALADGHWTRDPQISSPRRHAGEPRGVAAADRERDEAVRVLVEDQLAPAGRRRTSRRRSA